MKLKELSVQKEEKIYFLILGITSAITFFSNLWTRGADLMESRNFITSREIIESGNWLVTTLNGEYRFEKPPLPSWLTAGVMKITGNLHDEWVLRLPSALIAFITVFYIYRFVKKLTGNIKTAFFSSIVFSTSFLVIKTAGENTWDFYPYAFIFMALTHLMESFSKNRFLNCGIGGIFLGASLLSKGPVGVYGMLLPFLIAYGAIYRLETLKKNWTGITVFILVGILTASFWPALMLIENHELFISVLKKESKTWSTIHKKPFYFYLNYIYLNGIWSFFTLAWIFKFWSNRRTGDRKSFDFIYLWHISAFILLSLIKMKKERYGLPLYFTSSIGVGFLLSYYFEKSWDTLKKSDRFLLNIQGALLALVSLAVPVLFFIKGYLTKKIGLAYLILVTVIFGIFFIILMKNFLKNRIGYGKNMVFYTGISMVLLSLTTIWFIERDMRNKFEKESRYLKNFKNESEWKNLPVYAEDFAIWDVWNVGSQIKKLGNGELPEKLIYFSREEVSPDRNLPEALRGYRVVGKKNYLRALDSKKNIKLYNMEKE